MQPLFDVDLNKPEEFTSEAELLPFQPSTSSMLQCVTFQVLYVQNPSKPEVGSSLVSEGGGEMAGRVVVFVAGWGREAIKK